MTFVLTRINTEVFSRNIKWNMKTSGLIHDIMQTRGIKHDVDDDRARGGATPLTHAADKVTRGESSHYLFWYLITYNGVL